MSLFDGKPPYPIEYRRQQQAADWTTLMIAAGFGPLFVPGREVRFVRERMASWQGRQMVDGTPR